MTQAEFQNLSTTLPQQPGIYKYYDANNYLLYVGKAKNIKKRVSSYFNKTFINYKTHELVQRIHAIEFTIVNSEQDAFLLENSLIKQFQPRFNINLKDDKTYPYIVIKKEPFPRIFLTRNKVNDGSEYLGPFTSAGKVRELINFIRQHIPLRTCKLNLTHNNIRKGKFKVCLEYHLGNCKGPCESLQTEEDYAKGLQQIKQILRGNLQAIIQQYKQLMQEYAMALEFEKAEAIRKKLEYLETYQAKSVIVSKYLNNIDVFSILKEHTNAYVNYLMIQNGRIIQAHTVQLETPLEEDEQQVLAHAIFNLRTTFNSTAQEIIIPFELTLPGIPADTIVPKAGDKKKLLDLSITNVNYFKEELRKRKILQLESKTDQEKAKILYQLQQDLHLPEVPVHIECFDNSNFQGSYPVSAMVCFKNGIPSKPDYRHFNVKSVTGINDFATMKEVVYRRYSRLLNESKSLPQLVIVDGGKGQLSAAVESLSQLNLNGKLTIIGLAKNEEEIFFPGDQQSIKLSWNSESLKLIRRIRDEVHRFGISFHRNQRSKGTFVNELENIRGIGKQTATQLLQTFKSVNNIRVASFEDVAALIGVDKAKKVQNYFNTNESQ